MSTHTVSGGARRFVAVSALFLVASQLAALSGAGRRVVVTLLLYGFVFHMIFGKAYALVPSYFDRTLSHASAPTVQLPLSVLGTVTIAASGIGVSQGALAGSLLWTGGVLVFVGTLGWTIRDNLTGADTGTGGANADRKPVDRVANAFVPLALAYLLVGSVLFSLSELGVSQAAVASAQVSHLLAAGGGALLLFAVGFRLLPRFLVAHPPRILVWLVLPAGAAGPALIAFGLYSRLLVVGLVVESLAIVGFAAAYLVLFTRSPRRRVGFYGVLCGVLAGVVGVALAAVLALDGGAAPFVTAHYRTMLVGFLGLSIVGAAFQFYPPSVGEYPGTTDRTAAGSIALLAGGVLSQVVGLGAGIAPLTTAGEVSTVLGATLYAYLLGAAFWTRR